MLGPILRPVPAPPQIPPARLSGEQVLPGFKTLVEELDVSRIGAWQTRCGWITCGRMDGCEVLPEVSCQAGRRT